MTTNLFHRKWLVFGFWPGVQNSNRGAHRANRHSMKDKHSPTFCRLQILLHEPCWTLPAHFLDARGPQFFLILISPQHTLLCNNINTNVGVQKYEAFWRHFRFLHFLHWSSSLVFPLFISILTSLNLNVPLLAPQIASPNDLIKSPNNSIALVTNAQKNKLAHAKINVFPSYNLLMDIPIWINVWILCPILQNLASPTNAPNARFTHPCPLFETHLLISFGFFTPQFFHTYYILTFSIYHVSTY
jgi:hypothetical protein